MDTQYLSKEKLEELKNELNQLKTTKRGEIAERLKAAKDFGDLSENSEYSEAREEQARVEGRIFELEEMLKQASIIEKSSSVSEVHVGSTVTVKKDGKTLSYNIVGSNETVPEQGKISNESPLGKALLGRKVGDNVSFQTPGGEATYTISKIE